MLLNVLTKDFHFHTVVDIYPRPELLLSTAPFNTTLFSPILAHHYTVPFRT